MFIRLSAPFRNITLRNKIFLSFLTLIISTTMIIMMFSYMRSVKMSENNAINYSTQTLKEMQQNIEYVMNDIENISRFLLYDESVQRFFKKASGEPVYEEEAQIKALITNLASYKSYVYSIFITNERDKSVSYGRGGSFIYDFDNVIKEKWYQDSLKMEGMYSWNRTKYVSSVNDSSYENYFTLARAINDKNSMLKIGSLIININEDYFIDLFSRIQMGKTGLFFIADKKSRKILDINRPAQDMTLLEPLVEETNSNRSGYFYKEINGKKNLITYQNFEHVNWTIMGIVPFDEMDREARTIRNFTILLTLLAIAVTVTFSIIISSGVTRPLSRLIVLMKRVEKGDFTVKVGEDRHDEVGNLGKTFNKMISELNKLVHEVYYEKIQRKDAELQALQAQINPHFLYNTLDTINWMAMIKNEVEISSMVVALSKVFRMSLSKGRKLISIGEEVEHIRNYLVIQQYRFGDKLMVDLEVDQSLYPYKTVKTMLQPLIENSIVHGIAKIEGEGKISIKGYQDEDTIVIEILDNGAGINIKHMESILSQGPGTDHKQGYGVYNVNERIKLAFGDEYGLTYFNRPGGGTKVVVRIPQVLTNDGEEEKEAAQDIC